MTGSLVHNFKDSLATSHAASDLPFWRECYLQAFPTMRAMIDHREDGFHQRQGVDRSIVLANSKQILIDEKVRGRNKKTNRVYPDIALEYLSSVEHSTPGWVCKSLMCDYIAYAIAPLGRCYLLPVNQLQSAWKVNRDEWMARSDTKQIDAQNNGYRTRSLCIPVGVLFTALGQQFRLSFTPCEVEV